MNVLFQPFPETVRVNGEDFRIVTDFREWIKLHEFLQNTERFTAGTLQIVLEWYIDPPPKDDKEAVRALQEFMAASELYESDLPDEEQGGRQRQPKDVFSFEQDAACIYSAFYAVYGIDITSIPYLHWWQFLTLFEGLPSDTEIKERIYYRGVDMNEIEDKAERKRIKKIRQKIAIRQKRRRKKMDDYEIGAMF